MKRPRMTCVRCGKIVAVRRDGKLHAHNMPTYGGYYVGRLCEGTGTEGRPA